MTVRGIVLIEGEVGQAKSVGQALGQIKLQSAKIVSVDTITGPFDVIVLLESPDLDGLGRAVAEGIQKISGVRRTVTCVVMEPV